MRRIVSGVVILAGVIGLTSEAVAGNHGLPLMFKLLSQLLGTALNKAVRRIRRRQPAIFHPHQNALYMIGKIDEVKR